MFVCLNVNHVLPPLWSMTSKWVFLLPSFMGSMHKVVTFSYVLFTRQDFSIGSWVISFMTNSHQMKKRFLRYEIIVEFHLHRSSNSMSKFNDRSRGRGSPKPRLRPRRSEAVARADEVRSRGRDRGFEAAGFFFQSAGPLKSIGIHMSPCLTFLFHCLSSFFSEDSSIFSSEHC